MHLGMWGRHGGHGRRHLLSHPRHPAEPSHAQLAGMTSDAEPNPSSGTDPHLGHRAAHGTLITLVGQGLNLAVQMASVIVLARLLSPRAYGLVAMVLAVVGVAHIFRDFGLSPAAIQAPSLSHAQRNNLFWLNTGIGTVLALAMVLAAPIIQAVYQTEHIADITRALAITFLLSGAATQFRADLNRSLSFLKLAAADVLSSLLALGIAILVAVSGGSYWALVAQQITQGTTLLVMVVVMAGWIPRAWVRGTPIKSFLTFGWNIVGSQLINYVANNLDSFIIGVRFGAGPAGLYNRAFQLLMRPLTQLRSPSTTVALPTLARLQEDPERYGRYLLRGQVTLSYPITILLAVVAGASAPIVDLFLGQQWHGAIPIIQFLTIAGVFQTLAFVGLWVYLSQGLTRELRRYTLLSASIRAICVGLGSFCGATGVAAGYGLGPAIAWPLAIWWLNRKTQIPAQDLFKTGLKIITLGLFVFGASLAVSTLLAGEAPPLRLLGSAVSAVITFSVVATTVPAYRRDAHQIFEVLQKGLTRSPIRAK